MATLCLDLELENYARRDLHDWLGAAWALLFSNPEDFQPHGRGAGPWLDRMRREFSVREVRGLNVRRDGGPAEPSWVDKVDYDSQLVRLREPSFVAADTVSFAARALRGELLTLQSRFVMCIDGSLKRRGMLKYRDDRSAICPPDPFELVDALHSRRSIGRAA